MAKKNTVFNNLPEDETLWADTKRWLGMPLTTTHYQVDENRLYCKTGLIKTEINELLLYRILDIKSSQTLGQRLCGVGTVTLYCSDKSDGVLELKNVRRPDQVRRFLSNLVEAKRAETGIKGREIYGSGSPMPPHPGPDPHCEPDCDCGHHEQED